MSFLSYVPGTMVLTNPHDPVESHRDVMSLFGQINTPTPRASANILFRQEPDAQMTLLIRSDIEPVKTLPLLQTIPVQAVPAEGVHVIFQVTLNAVHRLRSERSATKPIDDSFESLQPGGNLFDFVARKLSPALSVQELVFHHRSLGESRTKKKVTLQKDRIHGIAKVVDQESLKGLLATGVGRGKAYGCGLLTVTPLGGSVE